MILNNQHNNRFIIIILAYTNKGEKICSLQNIFI